jgi:3-deoxy-D-manno-octulosonic-acid transferase
LALGVPAQKVRVTGNIKFDARTGDTPATEKPSPAFPWIIFGSTRPGDEGPVMKSILRLKKDLPDLNFAIAPRHVDRCQEIESLIMEYDVKFKLHSELAPDEEDAKGEIILIDTMGELQSYYAKATLAFVGGGFNPRFGGQNILEPAALGLPVIFGKHMQNFEEEARLLKESGGGIQIDNQSELYSALHGLLTQPEERARRGKSAAKTIKENQGAVQRNIDIIEQTET